MEKILEKAKKMYNKDFPLKGEWVIAIVIALIMLIMFNYIDLVTLTVSSTNILDCIANGEITKYYEYTGMNKYNLYHQYFNGSYPLYALLVWAIWNIPIWIIQYFGGIAIANNSLMLLWSKMFLVTALGVTLLFTYKICNFLFKDKKQSMWIIFLSATSIYTYVGIFYAGQNDILICMCATIALYNLLKKKIFYFYLFSIMAITVKYFFLIPFIPIVLLIEKDIKKIVMKLGISIVPIILFKLIVKNFPLSNITSPNDTTIMKGLLSGVNGFSFFIISLIVLCFIAYIIKLKTKNMRDKYIVYMFVAPFMIMFMFSGYYEFYRLILLIPFLMILYGFKPQIFRINVILDTILSIVYFIRMALSSSFFFSSTFAMKGTILTQMLQINEIGEKSPLKFLETCFPEYCDIIWNVSVSLMTVILGIILVINYPQLKIKEEEKEQPQRLERYIIWIRMMFFVPVMMYLIEAFK